MKMGGGIYFENTDSVSSVSSVSSVALKEMFKQGLRTFVFAFKLWLLVAVLRVSALVPCFVQIPRKTNTLLYVSGYQLQENG